MKKVFLWCITFFVVHIVSVQAQQNGGFGVRAGMNASTMRGATEIFYQLNDQQIGYKVVPRLSFHVGAYAMVPIGRSIFFRPELVYSEKGTANPEFEDLTYTGEYQLDKKIYHRFNYIDIPLLLEIRPVPQFSIMVGPQFSYLLSAKQKLENLEFDYLSEPVFLEGALRLNPEYDKVLDNFLVASQPRVQLERRKPFGLGGAFGMAYNFNFGLSLGARVEHDITSIFGPLNVSSELDGGIFTSNLGVYNFTGQVYASFTFAKIKNNNRKKQGGYINGQTGRPRGQYIKQNKR